jgi:hypothetical protein
MVFSTVAAYNVIPSKARDRPARGYRVMFVYILASKTRRLYVGVTGDLVRRVWEHKTGLVAGFTRRYGIDRLVYFEIIKEARSHRFDEPRLGGPGGALVRERRAGRSLATLGMTCYERLGLPSPDRRVLQRPGGVPHQSLPYDSRLGHRIQVRDVPAGWPAHQSELVQPHHRVIPELDVHAGDLGQGLQQPGLLFQQVERHFRV